MSRKFTLPFGLARLRFANWVAFAAMLALMAIGVCYIYSANAFRASARLQALYLDQARLCVVCAAGGLALALIDYRAILRWSAAFYLAAVALLAAVLFFGTTRMGATRWIFGLQPSELAKVATIMATAQFLGRRDAARDGWDLLFAALLALLPMALTVLEPDLGTALVFAPVAAAMLFASGTALRWLIPLVLAGALAAAAVLGAVHETQDLWTRLAAERSRGADLAEAVRRDEEALEAARSLYEAGRSDYTAVTVRQTALLSARLSLAQHRADLATLTASLVKALGGM